MHAAEPSSECSSTQMFPAALQVRLNAGPRLLWLYSWTHHAAKSHLVPVLNLLKQHHLRGAWCVYAFAQELQIKGFWDLAGNVSGNTGNDIFPAEPCSHWPNSWLQIHLQHL